jgi:hypothetical protein
MQGVAGFDRAHFKEQKALLNERLASLVSITDGSL